MFFHLLLGLPSGFLFPGFPNKILYSFLISPMLAPCFAQILLDLIFLLIFDEEYTLQSSLLCNFLRSAATFTCSVHIISSALFSQTSYVCLLLLGWKIKSHIHKKTTSNNSCIIYFSKYVLALRCWKLSLLCLVRPVKPDIAWGHRHVSVRPDSSPKYPFSSSFIT